MEPPLEILSIEILSDKAMIDLCRHARRERKKRRQRFLNMPGSDLSKLLEMDISNFRADLALGVTNSNSTTTQDLGGDLALPRLSDDQVGRYEDRQEVALLVFAKNVGKPVLVELDHEPSNRSVNRLRQSAKIRKWTLRVFRVIDRYLVAQVHSNLPSKSDVKFLKNLGISGT
jgi:hypothetical protein